MTNFTSADFDPNFCVPLGPVEWVFVGVEVLLIIIIVLGNILVVLSVIFVKTLRKPHNYLLLSLAVADLLVGGLILPYSIVLQFHCVDLQVGAFLCKIWAAADIICCTTSINNLTAIALDRYTAISSPFFYKVHATTRTTLIVIIFTWIGSAVLFLPNILIFGNGHQLEGGNSIAVCSPAKSDWGQYFLCVSVGGFIPILIMLFVYAKLILVLHKQKRKEPAWKHRSNPSSTAMKAENVPLAPPLYNVPAKLEQSSSQAAFDKVMEALRANKGIAMLVTVMAAFLICWLPFFIFVFTVTFFRLVGIACRPPGWVGLILILLGCANSALNPFIYAYFAPEFRQAFRGILLCRCDSVNDRIRRSNFTTATVQFDK